MAVNGKISSLVGGECEKELYWEGRLLSRHINKFSHLILERLRAK
jgi:hypothetical protein